MAMAPNRQVILQKFYVYDPGVHAGDELGGLRVIKEEKKNGDKGDDNLHVLAMPQMVQWWIDQGLAGREPLSKLGGPAKKLLAQITRGRSANPDDDPKRVPKYDKKAQSGAPSFALSSPSAERMNKRKRDRAKAKKDKRPSQQPVPKQPV
jgi:hypothetical protein